MLGHSHALSGAAAGTAAGLYVFPGSVPHTALLAALTAGFATLPDLDSTGACAARSLGPLTRGLAWVVEHVSGGHRHGTHSIPGLLAATGLACGAWALRGTVPGGVVLLMLAVLAFAAAWRALHAHGLIAEVLAALGLLLFGLNMPLSVVPLACGLGWVTHLLGDSCTDSGVMWAWPFSDHRWHLPEPVAFTTGTRPERWLVSPALVLLLGFLSWHTLVLAVH